MALGFSFAPTEDQAMQARAGTTTPPPGGQQSLQTLNFKLPTVTGAASAGATVPGGLSPLLSDRPSGQGASFSSAVLQSVMRTLLGGDHANAFSALQGPADTTPGSGGRIDYGTVGIPVSPGGDEHIDDGTRGMPTRVSAAPQPRSPFTQPQDRQPSAASFPGVPMATITAGEKVGQAPDVPNFATPDRSVGGGAFPGAWHAMKADEYANVDRNQY